MPQKVQIIRRFSLYTFQLYWHNNRSRSKSFIITVMKWFTDAPPSSGFYTTTVKANQKCLSQRQLWLWTRSVQVKRVTCLLFVSTLSKERASRGREGDSSVPSAAPTWTEAHRSKSTTERAWKTTWPFATGGKNTVGALFFTYVYIYVNTC